MGVFHVEHPLNLSIMALGAIIGAASLGLSAYQAYKANKERDEEKENRNRIQNENRKQNAVKNTQAANANNVALQVAKLKQAGLNPNTYSSGISQPQQSGAQNQETNEISNSSFEKQNKVIADLTQTVLELKNQLNAQNTLEETARHNQATEDIAAAQNEISSRQVDINAETQRVESEKASDVRRDIEERIRASKVNTHVNQERLKIEKNMSAQQIKKMNAEIEQLRKQGDLTEAQTHLTNTQKEYQREILDNEQFAKDLQKWVGLRPEDMTPTQKMEVVTALKQQDWGRLCKINAYTSNIEGSMELSEQMAKYELLQKQLGTISSQKDIDAYTWNTYVRPLLQTGTAVAGALIMKK